MKIYKNKLIGLLVVFFITFFSFNIKSFALTCSYTLPGEILESSKNYNGDSVEHYPGLKGVVGDSNYLFHYAYINGKNSSSASDAIKVVNDFIVHIGGTHDLRGDFDYVSELNFKFDFIGSGLGNKKFEAVIYNTYQPWLSPLVLGSLNGAVELNTLDLGDINADSLINSVKSEKCPTAIPVYFTFDIYNSENAYEEAVQIYLWDYTVPMKTGKAYYLEDYNYNFDKMTMAASSDLNNQFFIMLYNITADYDKPTDGYNYVDTVYKIDNYFKARTCALQNYSSGFGSDSLEFSSGEKYKTVNQIIDKANEGEYSIRKIYEKVNNFSEDDLRSTFEQLEKGELQFTEVQQDIYNFLTTLSYFDTNDSARAVLEEIKKDYGTLVGYQEQYGDQIGSCMADAFDMSSSELAFKQYLYYDNSYDGLYVEPMMIFLGKLKEIDVAGIQAFITSSAEEDFKENSNNCDNIPHTPSYEACLKSEIESSFNKVDCTVLFSKDPATLTPAENLMKQEVNYAYENATGAPTGESDSRLWKTEKCKSLQNNSNELATDIVNGESDAQKDVNEYVDDIYQGMIQHTGININQKICSLIDESVREYILGGLTAITIVGPLLVIFLTLFDAIKYFASFKDSEDKTFFNKLKVRIICMILLFIVPIIVRFLLNLILHIDEPCL